MSVPLCADQAPKIGDMTPLRGALGAGNEFGTPQELTVGEATKHCHANRRDGVVGFTFHNLPAEQGGSRGKERARPLGKVVCHFKTSAVCNDAEHWYSYLLPGVSPETPLPEKPGMPPAAAHASAPATGELTASQAARGEDSGATMERQRSNVPSCRCGALCEEGREACRQCLGQQEAEAAVLRRCQDEKSLTFHSGGPGVAAGASNAGQPQIQEGLPHATFDAASNGAVPPDRPLSPTTERLLIDNGLGQYIEALVREGYGEWHTPGLIERLSVGGGWSEEKRKSEAQGMYRACGVKPGHKVKFERLLFSQSDSQGGVARVGDAAGGGGGYGHRQGAQPKLEPQQLNCAYCGKQPRYHGHPFCGKGCSARATQDGWIDGRPPYGWAHTKRLPPPPRHTPPLGRWSALGKPKPAGPILFYEAHEDFYEFTNFWVCDQLTLDGQKWRTTEHYFQAQKFIDPQLKEICRLKATPRECFELVREPRCRGLIRGDWHRTEPGYADSTKDAVMFNAALGKFSEDPRLRALLLSTGKRKIIEHTVNDSYWCVRYVCLPTPV